MTRPSPPLREAVAKILTRERAVAESSRLAGRGLSVVFTNGCFDLLHAGHVSYLEAARALGDALFVGLNSDSSVRRSKGGSRPIIPEAERAEVLAALAAVDVVTLFDEPTPFELVQALRPSVLVKGEDWAADAIVGSDLVTSWGGRVVRVPLVAGRSTSALIAAVRAGRPLGGA